MIIRRVKRKKYSFYAMDIESHNDTESIAKRETSMWLGSFINDDSIMEDESCYFYTMEEFLSKCKTLTNAKRKNKDESRPCRNICVYIYNLSFEWSFLLPILLKLGFKYKEFIEKDDEYCFNSITTKSVSSVWQVNIKFNKSSGNLMLRDLSKIFSGGLGKVAKSFGLPTQKGEIDYRLNRLHNYKITKEEKEYCFKDTRIIIDILLEMAKRDDKEFFNSDSVSSYAMLKLIKTGWSREYKPYQKFRSIYPELDDKENAFLRKGVAGGITYAPRRWQFKDIKQKVLHIDAHQMHPTQAFKHRFPYGKGVYFKGKPNLKFGEESACVRIKISYTGVKLHSVIELIGIEFVDDYELTVWNFEIPTMYKVYENLKITYIDGYKYKVKFLRWRSFYSNNYKLRLIAKHTKDEFGIMFYKLLNNCSYGKLLEKPHNITFENCLNELGIITSIEHPKEELKVNAKYTYLPVGSSIPAWSRVCLIETALRFGWKKVVYFDTDSIFVLYDEETKKVWESSEINKDDFLGGWGLEEILERSQYSAPKRYKTEKIDLVGDNFITLSTDVKMAGINFDRDYYYDDLNITNSAWEVKRAYRVKGGTIIDTQRKEIGVQEKYKEIYNENIK